MKKSLRNSLLIAGATTTIGLSSLVGISAVSAHSGGDSDLVEKIATKFNLDQSEVQAVFDAEHKQREEEREHVISVRLDALVEKGTITEKQKNAIEAKLAEMREQRDADRDEFEELSQDERQAKMEQYRSELESWAEKNNIDLSKLKGVFMPVGHREGHHGQHHEGGMHR